MRHQRRERHVERLRREPGTGALTALPFQPHQPRRGRLVVRGRASGGSPVIVADITGHVASFNITATTASAAVGSPYTTLGVSIVLPATSAGTELRTPAATLGLRSPGSAPRIRASSRRYPDPYLISAFCIRKALRLMAPAAFAASFARRVTAFTISGVPTGDRHPLFCPACLRRSTPCCIRPVSIWWRTSQAIRWRVRNQRQRQIRDRADRSEWIPFATAGHGTEVLALTRRRPAGGGQRRLRTT